MAAKEKIEKIREELRKLPRLLRNEIWHTSVVGERSLRGRYFALLRFLSITWQGILDNRIFGSAAALSYSSLLALGPLVAIVIMVSGFVLQNSDDEDVAARMLTRAIYFVAPQTQDYSQTEPEKMGPAAKKSQDAGQAKAADNKAEPKTVENASGEERVPMTIEGEDGEEIPLNPELVDFINNLVDKSRSGAVGLLGSLILIAISIQLIISIENTFNSIWGVRRGRAWMHRVVLYWTLISLGAVLGFAAIFLLTASTIKRFFDHIPFGIGESLFQLGMLGAPLVSFAILVFLLAVFYRFIPNCHVSWRPALVGGFIVALLLVANNYLSFLYIDRVVRAQSLYGSVGIVPILMFGLYVFWVFALLGGQITYGIQNVDLLTNQRAWSHTSPQTRQLLSLAALLTVARRFLDCDPPISQSELADKLRVPVNVLNESLTQLVDMGMISLVDVDDDDEEDAVHYQPGRPLERISLASFKEALENAGNREGGDLLLGVDPVLRLYQQELLDYTDKKEANRSLADLLNNYKGEERQPC